MPKFSYVAMDAKGREVSGTLDTDNSASAIAKLREMGYFPTNVSEMGGRAEKNPAATAAAALGETRAPAKRGFLKMELKLPAFLGGRVKSKELTAVTRQLATLIDAGLPLVRGLNVLRKQEKNLTMKRVLGEIAESVESGSTFSEALAQHPKIFPRLYVNMVRAGEAGGVLDVTLNRLAEFQEKAQKIKGKVVSAMVYPCVVLTVAIGILFFLMIVVIPKFEEVFRDLLEGQGLPALTQAVLQFSRVLKDKFLFVFLTIVAVVVAVKLLAKTTKGRYIVDKIKINAPIFGDLVRKVGISRFTRTLGTLIASGVPILQALNIVRETAGNAVIAEAVGRVHDSVKEGESIVQPLEASGVFPPMVVSMVDVGEETGALPDMLLKIADTYDDEVDNAVAAMTSLLEPILIVFLALVVGTIVISLFMPLIGIINKLGGA
jgi:type IV pilus assembly protein PilC